MIGVLHGGEKASEEGKDGPSSRKLGGSDEDDEESRALMAEDSHSVEDYEWRQDQDQIARQNSRSETAQRDWRKQIRLLTFSFLGSGIYVRISSSLNGLGNSLCIDRVFSRR